MRVKKRVFCSLLLAVLTVPVLRAQMAGSPVETRGKSEWTVSVVGAYLNQEQGSEQAVSRRALLKSTWGLTSWLDVYGLGGGVQLEMKTPRAGVSDYKGKYRLGYGAGFNLALLPASTTGFVGIWAGAQALRFISEGSFVESFLIEEEGFSRAFEMEYDWREFQGHLGMVFPFRFLRFYTAVVGWGVQRLDTKREYLVYGETRNFVGEVEGEYRSGVWAGGVVGLELVLPQRYAISVEYLLLNENDYQITVGICQTGVANW